MFDVKVYNNSQIKLVRSLGTQGVEMLKAKAKEVGEDIESKDFMHFKSLIMKYVSSCTEFIERCSDEDRTVDELAIGYMQRKIDFIKNQTLSHYRVKRQQIAGTGSMTLQLSNYWENISDKVRTLRSAYKPTSRPALFV